MIALRPYQERAVRAVRAHWATLPKLPAEQRRGALAVLPTGTGKTLLAMSQVVAAARRLRRVLWIGHTDELIAQPRAAFVAMAPDLASLAGTVKAEQDDAAALVVFASRQTLQVPERLARYLSHGAPTLVVIDEAHHSPSPAYVEILARIRDVGEPLLLGLTATPSRADGVALHRQWRTVSHYPIAQAVQEGYLVPWRSVVRRLPDLDLSRIMPTGDWDVDPAVMGRELLLAHVVEHTTAAMVEHARGRRAMVFCCTIQQAQETAAALTAAGIKAVAVSDRTPKDVRRAAVRQLGEGKIDAICNVRCLTEGTDIPAVDCIVVAAPTRSKGLYVQMVGRGLRPSDRTAKVDCLIIDIAGASEEHDLVQAPVLIEDDEGGDTLPRGAVSLASVGLAIARIDGEIVLVQVRGNTPAWYAGLRAGNVLRSIAGVACLSLAGVTATLVAHQGRTVEVLTTTGAHSLDVPRWTLDRDMLGGLRGIRRRTVYAWADVPGLDREVVALDAGAAGQVVAVELDGLWRAWLLRSAGEDRKRPPPEDLTGGPVPWDLVEGIGGDVARRAEASGLVYAGAAWRAGPATEKQVKALARFGVFETDTMSAGDAAQALTAQILLGQIARLGLARRVAPSRRREETQ